MNIIVNCATGEVSEVPGDIRQNEERAESIHAAWLEAALATLGVLDAVESAVRAGGAAKFALWKRATEISRNDRDVMAIAAALHINLNRVFELAAELRDSR